MLNAIIWDVSPVIVRIGPIALRWYSLLFAAAFIAGYFIVQWMFRREGRPERHLDALLIYMLVGTIVGARLGHVLFYDPGYYFSQPLEILKIWRGGLASHGGAIGILTALYLFSRRTHEISFMWLLDRVAVPTALGGFFIRLGNLFNSEILGTHTDVPWGFVFARVDPLPRHPAQLYEALGYGLIFLLLIALYRRRKPEGTLFGLFLVCVFAYRFFVEFFKMEQAAFTIGVPLSMGQLLSIPMVVAGVVMLVWAWTRPTVARPH